MCMLKYRNVFHALLVFHRINAPSRCRVSVIEILRRIVNVLLPL